MHFIQHFSVIIVFLDHYQIDRQNCDGLFSHFYGFRLAFDKKKWYPIVVKYVGRLARERPEQSGTEGARKHSQVKGPRHDDTL